MPLSRNPNSTFLPALFASPEPIHWPAPPNCLSEERSDEESWLDFNSADTDECGPESHSITSLAIKSCIHNPPNPSCRRNVASCAR